MLNVASDDGLDHRCCACGEFKPSAAFRKNAFGSYVTVCVSCQKERNRQQVHAKQERASGRPRKQPGPRGVKKNFYVTYMASPEWKALREKVYARDNHRCCRCGSQEKLQVHHLTYVRLGRERMGDLITLCGSCHRKEHAS